MLSYEALLAKTYESKDFVLSPHEFEGCLVEVNEKWPGIYWRTEVDLFGAFVRFNGAKIRMHRAELDDHVLCLHAAGIV